MSHDKGVRGREGVRWGRGRGREWGWEGGMGGKGGTGE